MGRETRHLWIGNFPDNTDEAAARSYFSQYGDVDKVEFLSDKNSPSGVTAVLSFLSILVANKIKKMSHKMGNNQLSTKYHDFTAVNADQTEAKERKPAPTRKRSPSGSPRPARGQKRKEPELVFDARKRVILCHRVPDNHSSSTLTSGYYHEFKQLGKIKVLWLHEHSRVKTIVVMYHDSEVAHHAFQELQGKSQFGKPMDLELVKDKDAYTHYPKADDPGPPHKQPIRQDRGPDRGQDRGQERGQERGQDRPYREREEDFGPAQAPDYSEEAVTDEGASSTLFVGNLSGAVRYKDLMNIFRKYGEIECIDMKESDKGFPYAFIKFYELRSAFLAKKYLNEEFLDERRMKIGYGKGCHTNTVMAMEIDRACPESKVEREFSKFGRLVRLTFNASLGSALLTYDNIESSAIAIENMRGRCIGRTGRVKVDFANIDECEEFYHNLERCKASQQLMRFHMDLLSQPPERAPPRGGDSRGGRYNEDGDERFPPRYVEPLDIGPPAGDKRERDVRPVYTRRNVRDVTPPSPVKPRYPRNTSDSRRGEQERREDWKGKEKRVISREAGDRSSREAERRKVLSYNSEEQRHTSDEREQRFRAKPKAKRSVSPKYSKYDKVKVETREVRKETREEGYSKMRPREERPREELGRPREELGRPRGPGLMDNDWNKKQLSPGAGARSKGYGKRDERDERDEGKRVRKHSVASPRERDLRKKKGEKKEEKRKKEKRRHDLSEEEELINSIIAMRREDMLKAARSSRKRAKPVKKSKKSKSSSEESSDESSSSSAATSEDEEIDVGESEMVKHPSPDTALERIAKIISDSTNGQVQLNPPAMECYSPGREEPLPDPQPLLGNMPGVQLPPVSNPGYIPIPSLPLNQSTELLALLRKYPIMWNGSLALKNDQAAVQFHFLSGSANIAEGAINALPNLGPGPMRIAQRMRLEPSQIDGVQKRIQHDGQWCMMLALPHGTDPISVSTQTTTLQHGFITYLQNKQAAGIINLPVPEQPSPFVLHIFPPCEFTQTHMRQFCPELIEGTDDCGYLLIVIATI